MEFAQESLRRARELQMKVLRASLRNQVKSPDQTLNDRDLASAVRYANSFAINPMASIEYDNQSVNKTLAPTKPLPEKLQRLRERVKRDRSANT
jgi:hypothetical protein